MSCQFPQHTMRATEWLWLRTQIWIKTYLAHFLRVSIFGQACNDHLQQLLCCLRLLHQVCRCSTAQTDAISQQCLATYTCLPLKLHTRGEAYCSVLLTNSPLLLAATATVLLTHHACSPCATAEPAATSYCCFAKHRY